MLVCRPGTALNLPPHRSRWVGRHVQQQSRFESFFKKERRCRQRDKRCKVSRTKLAVEAGASSQSRGHDAWPSCATVATEADATTQTEFREPCRYTNFASATVLRVRDSESRLVSKVFDGRLCDGSCVGSRIQVSPCDDQDACNRLTRISFVTDQRWHK